MDKTLARTKALDLTYAWLSVHFPKSAKKLRKEADLAKELYAEPETLEKLAAWYANLPGARKNMGAQELAVTNPLDMEGDPAGSQWSFEWQSEGAEEAAVPETADSKPVQEDASTSSEEEVKLPAAVVEKVEQQIEDELNKVAKKGKKKRKAEAQTNGIVEADDAESSSKKRKLEVETPVVDAVPVTTKTAEETIDSPAPPATNGETKSKKREKKVNTPNQPFRRVKVEEITFTDERLRDNSFTGMGAGEDDYGAKASRDLIVTRGDGFRKGKAKFKKGKHYGGAISQEVRSIKFAD